ncbi:ABC transporter ATP-binding protein [Anaerocolumna sp. AGMB13020]|uniref:ABC transporter ATP-binding protein n=1 Tax=Anaerocolumna sp. AGMB13020 TaxID=3081750 RepID=UPI002F428EAB
MENKDRKVLIRVQNLKQYFPIKKGMMQKEKLFVRANDDITVDIYEGETLGLVGESGCGKSTLGRTLLQLYNQTDGRTMYYGRDVDEIAPQYVLDILKSLVDRKKEYFVLNEKAATVKKQYDALPDGDAKYAMRTQLLEAEKNARDSFLDIVQLVGGFFVADDMAPISEVLVREYKAGVEYRKLNEKLNDTRIAYEGLRSTLKEKGKTQEQIAAGTENVLLQIKKQEEIIKIKERELEEIRNEIYKLMKKYESNPDFAKYEVYRDKGINLARLSEEESRKLRKDLQLIFQDPYSSLNPRMTVGQIISEGLLAHKYFDRNDEKLQNYVMEVMEKCGLAPYFIHRYPHQFSGGQRQRIGIARSLALKPKFVVCDEAVSALDVSIQSQIINLLLDLKEQENLTYLFISHDLSVIKYISDRVGVMYLGNIVELASTEELFAHPTHPYTEALLSAIPTTDVDNKKEAIILEGDIPSPIKPPTGCKFHTRCRYATDICKKVVPDFEEVRPGHFVACHHKIVNS